MTGTSAAQSKIVVAIELGTKRSGWALTINGNAEGDIIVRVPEGNPQGEKTETAALLSPPCFDVLVAFGSSAYERYTENKAAGRLFLNFMKDLNDPFTTAECGQRVPLLRVMGAVLGHFKTTALGFLSSASKDPVAVDDVAWVISVPAAYDAVARGVVRDAALRGGIIDTINSPQLELCTQPNAAYLAAYDQPSFDLLRRVGTKTMVLDCGATTVDITIHEVESLNPVRLRELVPPTVGAWGSTCVDSAFGEWLKDFIGEDAYSRVCRKVSFFDLMKRWEKRKAKFQGNREERVRIDIAEISDELSFTTTTVQDLRVEYNEARSSNMHLHGEGFIVILPSPLVESFYAPTIGMIRSCLGDMQRSFRRAGVSLDYVFLVGGFATSPLVQAAARAELDGNGCVVKSLCRPDVAIVKGSVITQDTSVMFDPPRSDLLSIMLSQEKQNHEETKQILAEKTQQVQGSCQQRNAIAKERERLITLLERERQEKERIQTECDMYKSTCRLVGGPSLEVHREYLNSGKEIQAEIKQTLTVWVSDWAEGMCARLGANDFVLPRLVAQVFLESQALVEHRRLEVYSFFLCGSIEPKTGIEMEQSTADFMLKHMRQHFKDIFPLNEVQLNLACETILNKLAVWMSGALKFVTPVEAAALLQSPGLMKCVKTYLYVLVCATLHHPRTEFTDDCGEEQDFDAQVHAAPIDGDVLQPGDKCVVVFPAIQGQHFDKAYILRALDP